MKKNIVYWLLIVSLLASLIAGCAAPAAAPTATAVPPTVSAATVAPATNTAVPPTVAPATNTPVPPTAAPTAAPTAMTAHDSLILATTTSTENSGLLKFILPDFEKANNVKVDIIAVGTGQALKLGQDGNADVLLVHARAQEDAFMAANHGTRREDVMYNDYVILGPEKDPAGIKGMKNAAKAMAQLADKKATFVSRGDNSGTHVKENDIWKAANITPSGSWYVSAGQGMGAVLTMANEQQAYTLSDRATYLARTLEGTDLKILVEGDPVLFNPYGVITVNPAKNPNIKADLATKFVDWIISLPTQELISTFGVAEFKAPLFTPDSTAWREAQAGAAATGAALKVTGKVTKEMSWTEAEVKAMPTMEATSTNKEGVASTYTGVSLNALLELAGVQAGTATLVLVADDGFTAEVPLADAQACKDCIVSFRNQGGFSMVMPGMSNKAQVKGVVEIQVK
ncbi:MAG: solute-binding protein [Chloroflexi bacterium]|nr:solute-binding protein [Chloroflexota bacterium]